jgi:hypothetical protein
MGAIFMPIFIWFISRWVMKKISMMEKSFQSVKRMAWASMNLKYKIIFILLFVGIFLFMQIIWRMMFEFLIAYMQIREALYN